MMTNFPPDHFCALVEEVFVPIFRNELNMAKFPQCVSDGESEMQEETQQIHR